MGKGCAFTQPAKLTSKVARTTRMVKVYSPPAKHAGTGSHPASIAARAVPGIPVHRRALLRRRAARGAPRDGRGAALVARGENPQRIEPRGDQRHRLGEVLLEVGR